MSQSTLQQIHSIDFQSFWLWLLTYLGINKNIGGTIPLDVLHKSCKELNSKDKTIFVMYIQGYDITKICITLHITRSTVANVVTTNIRRCCRNRVLYERNR